MKVNLVGSCCSSQRPCPQTLYDKDKASPCKCNHKLNKSLQEAKEEQRRATAKQLALELHRNLQANQLLVGHATTIEVASSNVSRTSARAKARARGAQGTGMRLKPIQNFNDTFMRGRT